MLPTNLQRIGNELEKSCHRMIETRLKPRATRRISNRTASASTPKRPNRSEPIRTDPQMPATLQPAIGLINQLRRDDHFTTATSMYKQKANGIKCKRLLRLSHGLCLFLGAGNGWRFSFVSLLWRPHSDRGGAEGASCVSPLN